MKKTTFATIVIASAAIGSIAVNLKMERSQKKRDQEALEQFQKNIKAIQSAYNKTIGDIKQGRRFDTFEDLQASMSEEIEFQKIIQSK